MLWFVTLHASMRGQRRESPWQRMTDRKLHAYVEPLLLVLAALFVVEQAINLSLVQHGTLSWPRFQPVVIWSLTIATAFAALQRWKPRHDPFLLPLFALFTGWGLVLQDRLAPNFIDRQTLWVVLGAVVMVTVALVPRGFETLRQFRYTFLIAGLLLLAATLIFGVNPSGFGAALWLPIPFLGGVFFQPSLLLRLLLIFFLAGYLADRERMSNSLDDRETVIRFLTPLLLVWVVCTALLVWQRDFGAATIFFVLFTVLTFLATGERRVLLGSGIALIIAALIGYVAFDVVALRIDTWLRPWPEFDNRAFQIVQSLYAFAAGGLFGSGVGQGFPDFIPVVHSDFVYAAIGEEWGLLGTLSILFCFAVLTTRGLRIALRCRDPFLLYLAVGIVVLLTTQALLIMGGVTKLIPLTGVTLPLLSYGGTSLLLTSTMFGILIWLSAAQQLEGDE